MCNLVDHLQIDQRSDLVRDGKRKQIRKNIPTIKQKTQDFFMENQNVKN